MIFLNALLAGGLLAAAAPMIVHILHRRQVVRIDWGAMRFLHQMLASSRRRIFLEQWLLMIIRMAALVFLAFALMRPALAPQPSTIDTIVRHGRTGAVLLIDDSQSTGAGRSERSIERMRTLAHTYLASLHDGDEISLIRLSQLGEGLPEPVLDRDLAHELIDAIEPQHIASDWPALIDAATTQLTKHLNPNLEVVMVSDGAAEGWDNQARARWADLRLRLHPDGEAALGSRQRPRLFVLEAPAIADEHNLAVTDITLDRTTVPIGRPIQIGVQVQHRGEHIPSGVRLRVVIDGIEIENRPLRMNPGSIHTITTQHMFRSGGSHIIEATIEGARDHLPADDHRAYALPVMAGLPVLLVEGTTGPGLQGSLAFADLALAPQATAPQPQAYGSKLRHGLFTVDRVNASDLVQSDLDDYRVVILGDLSALDNDNIARIENFVNAGGGVLIGLGPSSNLTHLNHFWGRDGSGLLPCPVHKIETTDAPLTPRIAERVHPALSAFLHDDGASWEGSDLRNYISLHTDELPADDIATLLRLDNGAPLLVERERGLGTVMLFASTLGPRWSDLVARPAYVPLMRGLVSHLGGRILPPRNLSPGERLSHAAGDTGQDLSAETPDGALLAMTPGRRRDRDVHVTKRLMNPGVYVVQEGEQLVHYAIAPPAEESNFQRLERTDRDRLLAGLEPHVFSDNDDLSQALALAKNDATELWQWFLIGCVTLLFIETAYTRRQSRRERGAS